MGGVVWQCMLEYWSCALLVREERTDGGRGVADNKASGNAVSEYQPVTYPRRHPCHHWSPKSIFIIYPNSKLGKLKSKTITHSLTH